MDLNYSFFSRKSHLKKKNRGFPKALEINFITLNSFFLLMWISLLSLHYCIKIQQSSYSQKWKNLCLKTRYKSQKPP